MSRFSYRIMSSNTANNDSTQTDPIVDTADSGSVSETDANLAALLDNLRAVTEERDEAKDQMLRTVAEMQNLRRRTQEQIEQVRKLATESLVARLLPVLDNFERSVESLGAGASPDAVLEGVKSIENQLRAALESVNVQKIETVGKKFDPKVHDAIATVQDEEADDDTVVEQLEAGYTMAGQVIRPAKVRVAKKP